MISMSRQASSSGSDRDMTVPRASDLRPIVVQVTPSHPIVLAARNADIACMDAPNPSANPTFASRAPLHIGAVTLKVRDLDRVGAFYRDAIGLAVLDRGNAGATLGVGGVPLVELEHRPTALPDDSRAAGLYHTAF